MANALNLTWLPPGPVANGFMNATARIQAIMGPVGSGKTQACFHKLIKLAARQQRSKIDGKRRFKACVVRDTYRRLADTTIPSWWKIIPKEASKWSGGFGEPARAVIPMILSDKTEAEFILDFIAIGDQNVEDAMRGYEPTVFYLNEADLLEGDVFTYALSRVGRYPMMADGGPSWYGLLADFNAPDTENWVFRRIVEAGSDDVGFFRQPSALSSTAENVKNLPKDYYPNLTKDQPEWWVRRYVKNEFGFSRDGKPVYAEFSDLVNVAGFELRPAAGLGLVIGLDAGLSPAAVICQHMPNGQWRVYDEVIGEPGTGSRRFGDALAQVLAERYGGWRQVQGWADPTAAYGADKERGEQTWIEIVSAAAEFPIDAAPTNQLIPRLDVVRHALTRLIDGEGGLLLSPTCKALRRGFNSTYRYRRLHVPGSTRWSEEPEKNEYSHVHDALQYALCGGGGTFELAARKDAYQWGSDVAAAAGTAL